MACIYGIRDLAGYPPGGTWTYKGYSTDNITFNATPAVPLVNEPKDTVLDWGDNFPLDTLDVSPGFYKFQYMSSTLVVEVLPKTQCAGVNATIELNENDTSTYNMADHLVGPACPSPTGGGTWADLDSAGAAFSNGQLTPSLLSSPGTYRFKYTINETGFSTKTCDNCNLEATVTANITTGLEAVLSTAASTCNWTLKLYHPDTGIENKAKVTVAADDEQATISWRKKVANCNGDQVNEIVSQKIWSVFQTVQTAYTFQSGGHAETLTLKKTPGNVTITVPLAPSGANQAVFEGAGGVTNANDLTYNTVNPGLFAISIQKAIINYLDTLGYAEITNFNLSGVAVTNGRLGITFGAKHNPTGNWVGIDSSVIVYRVYAGAPTDNNNTPSTVAQGSNIIDLYSKSPCPSGTAQLIYYDDLVQVPIDEGGSAYNSILIDLATIDIAPSVSSNVAETCNSVDITATVSGCDGNITYAWNTGGTTDTITVTDSGTYVVDLTCDNPVSTNTKSVTVTI